MLACTACSSDEPTPAPPMELSRAQVDMMNAQNDISLGLLTQLESSSQGNFAFSPFSIQQALSMIGNGVSDADIQRYMKVFGSESLANMNLFNQQLNSQMPMRDPAKVQISIANSMWQNSNYSFVPEYATTLNQYYNAKVQALDFAKKDIAGIVNDWVKKKTDGKIQNIYPGDQAVGNAVCFIANAFYFKGQWQEEFKESDTKPAPFYNWKGEQVSTVDMMLTQDRRVMYYGGENYNMVRLPYGNGAYEMAVLLPDPGVKVADVLKAVEKDALAEAFAKGEYEILNIKLPRFKINSVGKYSDMLEAAGVPLKTVDYDNLCSAIDYFDIYHGTDIVVDEKGTKIVSASVGSGMATSPGPSKSPNFVVDREFIFLVRECSSNSFLALGVVRNPAL